MTGTVSLHSRLTGLWRTTWNRGRADQELDEEVRAYVDLLAAEKARGGMRTDAARRAAAMETGIENVKESVRDAWGSALLDGLRRDVRQAVRALRRSPGFAVTAIATLSLGLGASTAIFSVINATFLRPTPGVADAGRLVVFNREQQRAQYGNFGRPDYQDYRDQSHSFSGILAHRTTPLTLGDTGAARALGDVVTGNYFSMLGATARRGRTLLPADDHAPGTGAVAVVSYNFWQGRLGADPAVIGRKLMLNRYPFEIIGVAQPGFAGIISSEPIDVWIPLSMTAQAFRNMPATVLDDRSAGWLSVVGRLRPGITVQSAEADVRTVAARLAKAYPTTNAQRSVSLTAGIGLYPGDRGDVASVLALLFGAVVLLLSIACANVAGLLLVRATARRREMAARLALGAARRRLLLQLLVEGMVLAFAATAIGVVLASGIAHLATVVEPASQLLRHVRPAVDIRVLGFAATAATLTGIGLTLLPALRISHATPMQAIKEGAAGAGQRRSLMQRGLVSLQVAASFVLLVGATLVLLTVRRVITADPGFATDHVAMAQLDLPAQGIDSAGGTAFYSAVLQRLHAMPNVVSASFAKTVPPRDWSDGETIFYPGTEPPREEFRVRQFKTGVRVDADLVAPGYFNTLRIPLLRGRDFTINDRAGAAGVIILSARLAQKLWPNENPLGKRISLPTNDGELRPTLEVVGVVADIRYRSLTLDHPLLMYLPTLQNYDGRTTIVVRTTGDAAMGIPAIQRAVHDVNAGVPVYSPTTMTGHMTSSLWTQRMLGSWITAFCALALLLSAIGLYGVMAQSVVQRNRELSIRMALGATPGALSRLVVGEGAVLIACGLAIGIPAAIVAQGLLRRVVEGTNPMPGQWMASAGAGLAALMVVACYLPARRAARMNPVEALRCE